MESASWNGQEFLVGGSTYFYQKPINRNNYGFNDGPLLALYYPEDNTLVNETSILPSFLLHNNGTIVQTVWNGSVFYILGEYGNVSESSENIVLFSYNPSTNQLQNMTHLLPSTLKAHMTGMIYTNYGLFLLLYGYYGANLTLLTPSGHVEDLSYILPPNFIFNDWSTEGTPMTFANGLLAIAGNYVSNNTADIITYNPQNGTHINYAPIMQNVTGYVTSVVYDLGFYVIVGSTDGYNSPSPAILWALYPLENTIYNLSDLVPSNFTQITTAASHDNQIFMSISFVGGVYFGELSLAAAFPVTFLESNLPSGLKWFVNITESNGTTYDSGAISGSSYIFYLPDGTYSYTIASSERSSVPIQSRGSFTVDGTPVSESVVFLSIFRYTVTFSENGLPKGTEWFVNLSNGRSYHSVSDIISFQEPNGIYAYTISTPDTSYKPPSSGSFTVDDSSVSVSVKFLQVDYTVTFSENGLPNGTEWFVNLSNGQSFSSTNSTISFSVPNGTYSYTITTVSGYRFHALSGSISLTGRGFSKSITFPTTDRSPEKSGISGASFYIIIVGVTAAVVGAVVAIMIRKKR
ncbi:MAG: hypothetical protein LVQ94_02375 [Thermoplasmatales archaeon]|nr:hypothetical protein [Thermoplasmatales archaeon]